MQGELMTNLEPVLKLERINKSFAGVKVLRDVSLDLLPGEIHCLVGENGAGKSTLIKVISRVYNPDSGSIYYNGVELHNHTPKWVRENGINTIYQEVDLVPHLDGAENISLGEEPLKATGNIDWKALRKNAQTIIDSMGVSIDLNVPVRSLKIADQQMIAIAKAASMKSKVMILDEPTSVFTIKEADVLFRIMNDLRAKGMALLYISHHLEEIFKIGDRVTVLRDGSVVTTGKLEEFDKKNLVHAMIGRDIDFSKRPQSTNRGEIALSVRKVTRPNYPEDVSMDLYRGEILGIAGLVGAGRTEFVSALFGSDVANSGEILVNGKLVYIKSPRDALRLGIGMVPENRTEKGIIAIRSISENISYSHIAKTTKLGFVHWGGIKKYSLNIMKRLKINPLEPNMKVAFLSGGNQQKVVLGKWIAADCEILILDEPTRGVDVGARTEIYDLMQELKNSGKAILMVSSDMTELLTQADRILVMAKRKIVGEIDGRKATEEDILSLALDLKSGE
jgi:ABC-type sugar transport system ATPase subunit